MKKDLSIWNAKGINKRFNDYWKKLGWKTYLIGFLVFYMAESVSMLFRLALEIFGMTKFLTFIVSWIYFVLIFHVLFFKVGYELLINKKKIKKNE